ncbi:MAG: hypothetical protein V1838_03805 [Patescibacteria group bacterium]
MIWANLFHIYQPPNWDPIIIARVVTESYRPLLSILKRQPDIKITLNINASLTEQLVQYKFNDIIDDLRLLGKRKQIEFTGSAKYHTILPLLPKEEVIRQIKLNSEVNKKYLGSVYKPRGFFPPEMCYSHKIAEIIKDLGFTWIALDEISYDGELGTARFDRSYQLRNGIIIIFRHRFLTDYISFSAPVNNPNKLVEVINEDTRVDGHLITAMDGENLGHHRLGADKMWEIAVQQFDTLTYSELIKKYKKVELINPLRSSWSSRPDDIKSGVPYALWQDPDNSIHQLQWSLTYLVIHLTHQAIGQNDPGADSARIKLDSALASDQYWWASAKPWWSLDIVIRETKELVDVITVLKSVPSADKKQVVDLYDMIVREAKRWQNEGIAAERAEEHRLQTKEVRYMGGRRII